MQVKRVSKIWVRMSTTDINLLQFKIWIRYIKINTKEKPSKIFKITFAILPFYQKKYSNWMVILSTLESTTLDETIRYDYNGSFKHKQCKI